MKQSGGSNPSVLLTSRVENLGRITQPQAEMYFSFPHVRMPWSNNPAVLRTHQCREWHSNPDWRHHWLSWLPADVANSESLLVWDVSNITGAVLWHGWPKIWLVLGFWYWPAMTLSLRPGDLEKLWHALSHDATILIYACPWFLEDFHWVVRLDTSYILLESSSVPGLFPVPLFLLV